MATLGLSEADRKSVEAFRRDVVEPSMSKLVIVDFWAEWCGPCKQLAPVIEKVAAEYADKGVLLVKINVDEDKFIASQFQIRSIPTVYALFQGQPVADLTPARTEGALKQAIDGILAQLPIEAGGDDQGPDIAPLIAMGEEILASGDAERALSIFEQIRELAPDNPEATAGAARALAALGQLDQAEALLDSLPADAAKDAAVGRARSAVSLAREALPVDDLSGLASRAKADPDDFDAYYELAGGLMAAGARDEAADALFHIIGRDRDWNDGAARSRLLKLFEVVGLEDPWVSAQRRRLSALLFT